MSITVVTTQAELDAVAGNRRSALVADILVVERDGRRL